MAEGLTERLGQLEQAGRRAAELIARLRSGVCDTAIVVTHDIEFAEMVADQMAILHQGQFVATGSPAEVHRSQNSAARAFLAGELRGS
jgi:ABC-2 type transport system ATP-binding protein